MESNSEFIRQDMIKNASEWNNYTICDYHIEFKEELNLIQF